MFKAGEKVIHHRFGEGVLVESDNDIIYPLTFKNNEEVIICYLTLDGKHHKDDLYPSIYYVPQTLDMSKPEPKIGTWGYFWYEGDMDICTFGKLIRIDKVSNKYLVTDDNKEYPYEHFSPEIPPHINELMNGTDTSNP